MIDGTHISQILACKKMLIWTKEQGYLMAQECLKNSIEYHEQQLNIEVDKLDRR